MTYRIRIDGIYDLRTLKHLKQIALKDYSFDFSPRSFNFIQEHVFLEQLVPQIGESDRVFFHFARSNDPMIKKLAADLNKTSLRSEQIFFEIDEWSTDVSAQDFEFQYLLQYENGVDYSKSLGKNFCGFIFNFSLFEDLYQKNILTKFATNFYTRFQHAITDSHMMILKMQWNSNLISSLFDYFEFNVVAMPISPDIEVCYRNVDLKKLSSEMELFKKNKFLEQNF